MLLTPPFLFPFTSFTAIDGGNEGQKFWWKTACTIKHCPCLPCQDQVQLSPHLLMQCWVDQTGGILYSPGCFLSDSCNLQLNNRKPTLRHPKFISAALIDLLTSHGQKSVWGFSIVSLNYLDKFLFVSAIALDLVPLLTVYWQLKRIDFSNSFAALANSRWKEVYNFPKIVIQHCIPYFSHHIRGTLQISTKKDRKKKGSTLSDHFWPTPGNVTAICA